MEARRTLDPYTVLGVPRSATPLQVARAHRDLAKRHHPDLHGSSESALDAADRMRRINEAWEILSDPVARADYDNAHPSAGTPLSGHWGASRTVIHPAQPSSTRTWATWRTTADATRAAPRTVRAPGEVITPRTRRPALPDPPPATFRDSGWAAVLVGFIFLLLLLAAVAAGRLAL